MGYLVEEYELLDRVDDRVLAEIVVFNSNKTIVNWVMSDIQSTVIYDRLDDFKKVSLNPSRQLIRHSVEGPYDKNPGYQKKENVE